MPRQVHAVYENGVLRPLQPLDLKAHEHVLVSIVAVAAPNRSSLAVDYIETIKKELRYSDRAPRVWKKSGGGLPKSQNRWPLNLLLSAGPAVQPISFAG